MSLVVYKASAGSGKTYTLTRDYILLSLAGYGTGAWRRILAVTFTNKAAAEMKDRIIHFLNQLSSGKDPDLLDWYYKETGISKEEITVKAGSILNEIIHDYGAFSVQTIDSFLQRVFRAFLFELDVNYSYDLLLDSGRMIEDTARALIFEVKKNSAAFSELIKFLEYSMFTEEKFNIQKDVTDLGKELTREELYKYLSELMEFLDDKEKTDRVNARLQKEINAYRVPVQNAIDESWQIIEENKLEAEDFSYGTKGVFSYIKNSKNGRFQFTINGNVIKCWKSRKYHSNSSKKDIIINRLSPLFDDIATRFSSENERIYGLWFAFRNLHVLSLLKYLEEKRKEHLLNNGFFYLGDVPRVLKGVLKQGGAGLIYEKTGNRFDNIFIDEFQDTSHLQWDNFRPLIENSLAQGMRCNIVGDVKQAIYRWRNGDWSILSSELKSEFKSEIKEETLDTNRRSLPAIIEFNNLFFEKCISVLSASKAPEGLPAIDDLYSDFRQKKWKSGEDQEGYVKVESFNHKLAEEYDEYIRNKVPELVNELWEKGCKDIAILVRSNREISEILEALISTSPPYPVVTEKSFRLDTHPSIRFLSSLLASIAFPDDRSIAVSTAWWYHISTGIKKEPEKVFTFHEKIGLAEFFSEKGYNTEKIFGINDPYTMSSTIAEEFRLGESDELQPYLSAFLDAVHQFQTSRSGTIQDFVKWYDDHKDDLQIQLEDIRSAVKIMTIHKSKGLQFSTVIIPYCGWKFKTGKQDRLWFHSDDKSLEEIPAVSIPMKSEISKTMFRNIFEEESYRITIDNLNMLYVAMTRPESQMFVFFPVRISENEKKENAETVSISRLMELAMPKTGIVADKKENGLVYSFGKPVEYIVQETSEGICNRISNGCYHKSPELVISVNRMQEVFSETDESIRHGILLHSILEKIITDSDFERISSDYFKKGIIDKSGFDSVSISFSTLMKNKEFAEWFSGKYNVYPEHTIVSDDGLHRPDRIMIQGNNAVVADYKTGSGDPEKYKSQIRRYIKLLKECGFSEVKGWIVQLDKCEIMEVAC